LVPRSLTAAPGGELAGDDDDPAELDALAGDELEGGYYG
jgi:hypothetical protein